MVAKTTISQIRANPYINQTELDVTPGSILSYMYNLALERNGLHSKKRAKTTS